MKVKSYMIDILNGNKYIKGVQRSIRLDDVSEEYFKGYLGGLESVYGASGIHVIPIV